MVKFSQEKNWKRAVQYRDGKEKRRFIEKRHDWREG